MKRNVLSENAIHGCTGCGMCATVCKFDALTIQESEDGFYRPQIDGEACTDCGMCRKVCYRFDDAYGVMDEEDYLCYSAKNKSDKELKNASSGAVSIELMRECLARGYFVVGVAYDTEKERAVSRIAKTEVELLAFRGSKYFQSDTAEAFREVVADTSDQKYAIFGTPCQIYAFSKVADLKKKQEKYLLIDIFCHGCPSLNLWDRYLESVKRKNKVDKFEDITFRSKTHGWHEYAIDFHAKGTSFSNSKYNDSFHELFFGKDAMNMACYDCIARSTVQKTDIRIGDFWGSRHDLDTEGISAVVLASERGKEVFEAVKEKFETESASFREIISAQSYKKIHKCNVVRRERVLAMLKQGIKIENVIKQYRKMLPFSVNCKRTVKSMLKRLPSAVYLKIKTKLR